MGIVDKLQGSFASLPPFAAALQAGVQDELSPMMARLAALETAVVQLGGQISSAAAAAAAAQAAADAAKTAAQTPPAPSPMASPAASPPAASPTTSGPTGPTPSPSAAISPSPTPTPSVTSRPTLFVIALPEPIFVGDIFNGGFRQTATIGISPQEGAFYVGSNMELSISNVDRTVEFVNWTNSVGETLGVSPTLITTVTEVNKAITANFRNKPATTTTGGTTTGGGTTGGGTTGGSGTSGGGGSLGGGGGGAIDDSTRI